MKIISHWTGKFYSFYKTHRNIKILINLQVYFIFFLGLQRYISINTIIMFSFLLLIMYIICIKKNYFISLNSFFLLNESANDSSYLTNNTLTIVNMIYITVVLSIVFALISYILSFFIYFLKSDYMKTAYECGFEPFDESMRHPFDIHFYVVGILFLVFDLEISCLVPSAFNIGSNTVNLYFIIIFLFIITIGFILEYNIGALDWFFIKLKKFNKKSIYSFIWMPSEVVSLCQNVVNKKFDIIYTFDYLNLLSLFIALLYLLSFIIEISKYYFMEKKKYSLDIIHFYYKMEFRFKIIFLLALFILIRSKLDYTLDILYYFNDQITICKLNLDFQIILLSLTFILLKVLKTYFLNKIKRFVLLPIFLFSNIIFLSILLIANNLLVVLLSIIGINLGLYIWLFDDTKKNRLESGLKYFFLSLIAVIFLYISIILIYFLTFSLEFGNLTETLFSITIYDQKLVYIIYIFILFIFFFKSGIFPGNFFLPEIYKGLSPYLFVYITLPIKAAFFGFIIKLFYLSIHLDGYIWFSYIIYAIIIFSFILGPLGAISSTDVYNFFAYISVTQLGWLLLGLISNQNISTVLLYYYYYFIVSSGFVYTITYNMSENLMTHTMVKFINHQRNPLVDVLLIFLLITLSGLPPAASFVPKLFILLNTYIDGYWLLVIIGIISSIFSGYYYMRLSYLLVLKLKRIQWFDFIININKWNKMTNIFFISLIFLYFIGWVLWPMLFLVNDFLLN